MASDKHIRVWELVDEVTKNWKIDIVVAHFGYISAMRIVSMVRPLTQLNGDDRLIFKLSTNGVFSVKKAYMALVNNNLP